MAPIKVKAKKQFGENMAQRICAKERRLSHRRKNRMQVIAQLSGKKESVNGQWEEIRIYPGVWGQATLGLDQ